MSEKKYKIIYADPPWKYKVYSDKGLGRSAESHYSTMTTDEICALPIEKLADRDCVLLMWVTMPCLMDGFRVLEAWGFTYKTVAFVWVKQNKKATVKIYRCFFIIEPLRRSILRQDWQDPWAAHIR